jgi:hypothetical protein
MNLQANPENFVVSITDISSVYLMYILHTTYSYYILEKDEKGYKRKHKEVIKWQIYIR